MRDESTTKPPHKPRDPETRPRGEGHANSKITVEIVRELRRRYAGGDISQKALAQEFGLSQSVVGDIILRRSWAHVDPDGSSPPEPKKRPERIERACLVCGKRFTVWPSRANKEREGLYCSLEHRREGTKKPWPARFWVKVNKDGPVQPHCPELGPCWEWTGARHAKGYGIAQGEDWHQQTFASRISWELANGAVPEGQYVLHRCDNPPCVRPEHLFLGTKADNLHDMISKGRQPAPESHASLGEKNPNAKLTAEQVLEIRALSAGGSSDGDLARRFNVSAGLIWQIVHRYAWKHLP